MKKTLLFNGCSFVAGDAIFWEEYCLKNNLPKIEWMEIWRSLDDLSEHLYQYSVNFRSERNLPAMVANHLGCPKVDISTDGNSNDNIAISTIAYLLNKSSEERKKFHVCIGWSIIGRFLKHFKTDKHSNFANLHVNHCSGKSQGGDSTYSYLQKYIDITFQTLTDEDLWLNYLKNIITLESFLIKNEITYTFFKSLGYPNDFRDLPTFPPFNINLPHDIETNNSNWYDFGGEGLAYTNHSWTSKFIILKKNWISEINSHPNVAAVTEFSKLLSDFIQTKKVL